MLANAPVRNRKAAQRSAGSGIRGERRRIGNEGSPAPGNLDAIGRFFAPGYIAEDWAITDLVEWLLRARKA
jgi:hypothetical protein